MQEEERFAVCSGDKEHDFYSLTLDLCYGCKDTAPLPFPRFFFNEMQRFYFGAGWHKRPSEDTPQYFCFTNN